LRHPNLALLHEFAPPVGRRLHRDGVHRRPNFEDVLTSGRRRRADDRDRRQSLRALFTRARYPAPRHLDRQLMLTRATTARRWSS
jgi:hypothetical protein